MKVFSFVARVVLGNHKIHVPIVTECSIGQYSYYLLEAFSSGLSYSIRRTSPKLLAMHKYNLELVIKSKTHKHSTVFNFKVLSTVTLSMH